MFFYKDVEKVTLIAAIENRTQMSALNSTKSMINRIERFEKQLLSLRSVINI